MVNPVPIRIARHFYPRGFAKSSPSLARSSYSMAAFGYFVLASESTGPECQITGPLSGGSGSRRT